MLSRSRTVGQQYTDPTKRRYYPFFKRNSQNCPPQKCGQHFFSAKKRGGEGTARIWPTERATGAFFPEKKGVEGGGERGGKGGKKWDFQGLFSFLLFRPRPRPIFRAIVKLSPLPSRWDQTTGIGRGEKKGPPSPTSFFDRNCRWGVG